MKGTKFLFYTSALFEFFKTVLKYWLSELKKNVNVISRVVSKVSLLASWSLKKAQTMLMLTEEGNGFKQLVGQKIQRELLCHCPGSTRWTRSGPHQLSVLHCDVKYYQKVEGQKKSKILFEDTKNPFLCAILW